MATQTSESVLTAARDRKLPVIAAAAGAAGIAGGLALGARRASRHKGITDLLSTRRTVLGVPIGRKRGLVVAAQALGTVAKELGSATRHVSNTSEDVHEIRDQLKAANKQSPIEVLLDGLTHRRGAHKDEQ